MIDVALHPDYSVLPDLLSLTVFIGAFRPLVRKAGSHVNLWFLGWSFILAHYLAVFFTPSPEPWHCICLVAQVWSLELCGLAFMRAAGNGPITRMGWMLTAEVALPVLLQSALSTLRIHDRRLQLGVLILLAIPAVHLFRRKAHRSRPMGTIAILIGVAGLVVVRFAFGSSELVTGCVLSILYLMAAYLYASHAHPFTRGALCAIVGLTGWGLSYPLVILFRFYHPGHPIDRSLLELPQYLVVAGIILNLLEDHVVRTERMAMHDPLTGLPNRRLFEQRFAAALDESQRERTPIACLVIDVDNFKHINDTLGHYTGDELLKTLATRLSWHIGPKDMLARTGGDEFTAMLAGIKDEYHLRFVASAMMSASSVPLVVGDQAIHFNISVGIAVSHHDDGETLDLRKAADDAMYQAKRKGGSLLAFAGEASGTPQFLS